jgi:hypothetical protein
MYKWTAAWEKDNEGYDYVDENSICEDCGEKYKNCECGDVIEEDHPDAPFDET